MSNPLRDALERIAAGHPDGAPWFGTAEKIAAEALAIAPEYEYRAAAGDAYDAREDYSGWTDDEQLARARVGTLDAKPPYALQWLERRTTAQAGQIERVP